MAESHLFIIEIPADLQLTEEEIATLEGHLQVDAGNVLDARESGDPPTTETNVNTVRVRTRIRTTEDLRARPPQGKPREKPATRKSGRKTTKKSPRKTPRK